jgi:predicted PurR-regulated permease PerM
MNDNAPSPARKVVVSTALEAAIRIGLVFLLIALCLQIVRPFIIPIVWGVIIAVAAYPGYQHLLAALGENRRLAATVFTLVALLVLIVPTMMLSGTLVGGVKGVATQLNDGGLSIPMPPPSVKNWPVIGEQVDSFWSLASRNIEAAASQIGPELRTFGKWLLATAAGAGFAILQFIVAIIIAGILMAHADGGYQAARAVTARLAGDQHTDFVALAEQTVRSVARGILGVAIIQSLLAGLGLLVAGVPAAGLWALLCLLLGVAQIGIFVVLIPIIIYLFNTADMVTAVGFLIWSIPVGLIDNVLKPILLARGVKTPMVVIFMGAIGGFLTSGIIGLFVGAVVLALSYEIFMLWLNQGALPTQAMDPNRVQDPAPPDPQG